MSTEKEPGPVIPFIDDGEERESERGPMGRDGRGQYNLTVTRNYKNKTRRVEISKILQDVEPMTNRSLSPVAPLANDPESLSEAEADPPDSRAPGTEDGTFTEAEFELTIKNNNSVIKIQGFDNKSTISFDSGKGSGQNMYDMLSREVDKIFRKPERREIERAMRSIKSGDKCEKKTKTGKTKKNTWKVLAKSLSLANVKRKDHRRGSVERYPKMVLLKDPDAETGKVGKPSLKSKNKEREASEKGRRGSKAEDEDAEGIEGRSGRKSEGESFKDEMEELERRKSVLRSDKKMNVIAEEKLRVELEKKLLGEEKAVLLEELELLKKEKEVLEKERNLLGEEKALLRRRHETGDDAWKTASGKPDEDLGYFSAPPIYAGLERCRCPSGCDGRASYYRRAEFCFPPRLEPPVQQKHGATQTEPSELVPQREIPEEPKDPDLPFGLLSSLFPRIVVIKSFQEEVTGDDAKVKIFDIPRSEAPIIENENEGEMGFETYHLVQSIDVGLEGGNATTAEEDEAAPTNENKLEMEKYTIVPAEEEGAMEEFPLTKIGRSIYEKLNQLAAERKKEAEEGNAERETDGEKGRCENRKPQNAASDIGDGGSETGTGGTAVVRKSELWHPCNAGPTGEDEDEAEGAFSLSVSSGDRVTFTIRREKASRRKPTKEAKVGTDGIDIVGGDFVCRKGSDVKNLSPRTDAALKSLRDALEKTEGINDGKTAEIKFPGLFFIQPIDPKRTFPRDDFIITKDRQRRKRQRNWETRVPGKSREYYCEECSATMRMLEEENLSVRDIVDKFETIIHLGSY